MILLYIVVQFVCKVNIFYIQFGGVFVFGKRIRAARTARKFTQQYVSDFLGMTVNAYQKYEQSERCPSLETLVKIADLFNVPTDWLLCRDNYLKSLGVSVDVFL